MGPANSQTRLEMASINVEENLAGFTFGRRQIGKANSWLNARSRYAFWVTFIFEMAFVHCIVIQ